ncbi:outer membrane beta-barrel protein [Bradyrhizobium sp.]|uniref:outer membrane protein n=1 Tax=Bradyrhizobium sp. TaxID=376 RepID=UPI001D24457C|nr:outer membrane beta-barrel protein [Bradyrhizobium sp.]MBI5320714.1 outer membrane beta-barrel protein [Bradyrhizobium sp.]
MKKIILLVAASGLSTGAASAADLAARPYAKAPAPVVAPVYNWGGFYIGLNGGGGSAHKCWDLIGGANGPVNPALPEGCHDATGGTAGGQIGYRWQATNWVFGLEAQGNWANFRGSNVNPAIANVVDNTTRIDAFGLFTGQIGYAFNNVLLYAKGGAAVVSDKYSQSVNQPNVFVNGVLAAVGQTFATGSETRWGGVAGVGIEFSFAPRWSVALEYDHLFMGTRDVNTNLIPPFGTGLAFTHRIRQDVDIGTVRVNYTFGGPVVAKY